MNRFVIAFCLICTLAACGKKSAAQVSVVNPLSGANVEFVKGADIS